MAALTEKQVQKLEAAGGKRWTKYDKDRIYFNATDLGLSCDYYKSGNISGAYFDGEGISNAEYMRVVSSKMYIDVTDGSIHEDFGRSAKYISDARKERFEAILADALKEEEPEQVAKMCVVTPEGYTSEFVEHEAILYKREDNTYYVEEGAAKNRSGLVYEYSKSYDVTAEEAEAFIADAKESKPLAWTR